MKKNVKTQPAMTIRELAAQTWQLVYYCEDYIVGRKTKLFDVSVLKNKIDIVKQCLES